MCLTVVGRTHSIGRLQTRIRRKDGSENFGGFVYVWDAFPQRDFVLWVFMCPNNITLSFDSIFASILPLFCVSSTATTPRATTPHLYCKGYHAFTTAGLPHLTCVFISRLPCHSSELNFWVITPELSRSTTHINRVITPALVSSW